MKKINLLITMFCACIVCNAQISDNVKWDYPVKPGSQEWDSFTSGLQMREACQIPEEILEELSTKDLVELCLNYPMWLDYTASNDERTGISFMINRFNGLDELIKRKEGVFELINAYKEYPVLTQIQEQSSKDYYTPYKLPFLELLLADDAFIKQLNEQESVELGKIVMEKYERKLENMHVYSLYNISKTFLLCAVNISNHSMNTKTPQQQNTIKRYIDNYRNADETLLTDISKVISGL